jgi:hypothetical protein
MMTAEAATPYGCYSAWFFRCDVESSSLLANLEYWDPEGWVGVAQRGRRARYRDLG